MSTVRDAHGGGSSHGRSRLPDDERPADRPAPAADRVVSPRTRRACLVYIAVSLPIVTGVAVAVDSVESYLLVFVLLASGAYTTPALVVTWLAAQRTAAADRTSWRLWLGGLACLYGIGVAMLVGVTTGLRVRHAGTAAILVTATVLIVALIRLVRQRSGGRALSVDVSEWAICLVSATAPAVLLWGETVVGAEDAWFAVPSALAAVATLGGAYWALMLHVRLGVDASTSERCGIAMALAGCANGAAQAAQGVEGFTLPAPPLIALHALTMSLLLLVPLELPRSARAGLDRLPSQAQVRGGGLSALVLLTGLPVLLGTTLLVRDEHSWAVPFSWGVLAVLLSLAAVRHLAIVRETRRLYHRVEQVSQQRRELLTEVMAQADEDRHRVAAQLHEQAVSTYASFVSFIQASGTPGSPDTPLLASASTQVRDDLARHADSLRQLMLTIAPLEPRRGGATYLTAPVRAYLDSLYGDCPAPELRLSVDGPLVLDWITETIALRIVQEAFRNVWSHSQADAVDVAILADGETVEVRIVDDGVGFDPVTAPPSGSGIAAMRSFAAVAEGVVTVESAPGAGTTVTARLGGAIDPPDASPPGGLRLLHGGLPGN